MADVTAHSGRQDGSQAPRPAPAGYGRLHPVPFDGCRAAGQERPSRRAHGHGRHRDRSLQGFHAVRCGRSALVRPRPVRAVERPRLDAALQPALSDRLQGHDARRVEAVPPDRQQDRRPPRIQARRRHRDDDRSARPRRRELGGLGARRAHHECQVRRRPVQALDLRLHGRRLPDGGHQRGGDLAWRATTSSAG